MNETPPPIQSTPSDSSVSQAHRQWAMWIHLSQFANVIFPLGIVAPIVLWQMKKNESAFIDEHGKIVVNWLISAVIYLAVSFVLAFLVIGFFLLFALGITAIVFAVIGGLKANEGKTWPYPLSIKFLK